MEKKRRKDIFKSDLIRNSSILIGGNVTGQVIAFLFIPILSRLYSVEEFGVFALFTSLTGILSMLSTGRYEEAFVMTKDRKEAASLLNLVTHILLTITIGLFLFLLFFRDSFFSLVRMESLTNYWYLIPVMVFATALFSSLSNLANREKRYKTIASANLSTNVLNSGLKLILGFFRTHTSGLIIGQSIGQLLACFSFYKLKDLIVHSFQTTKQERFLLVKRFVQFPLYNMPRNIVNSISVNIPFLFLTGYFGEAALGLYFMAYNVIFRPVSVVGNSLFQVLFERTTNMVHKKESIRPMFHSLLKTALCYILPFFVLAFIFAPYLFRYIFGAEWEESGLWFRYILPWMFILLISTSSDFLPLLFHKQNLFMWIEIVCFICRISGALIGIALGSFELTIALFTGISFLFKLITIILYYRLINHYEKDTNT